MKSFSIYEFKLKKFQLPLTNIVVYDIKNFIGFLAFPYYSCKYKMGKISGKYHRDTSEKEYQNV